MADFHIEIQRVTGTSAVVKISGDMTNADFGSLEEEFNQLLASETLGVALDLSGLESISSAGLGAILNMNAILAGNNGKLLIASPRLKMIGGFELLGLQNSVEIVDKLDQAKKMIASIKKEEKETGAE